MRIRLEKPKKENSLVVLLSVQVSPAQLGKMQLKKQINKQTKKPTPTKIFFFWKMFLQPWSVWKLEHSIYY